MNPLETKPTANGQPDSMTPPIGAYFPPLPNDPAPDPFDVERLRLPIDDADLGVEELLVSVPYRRPSKEVFFRVHPNPDYRCKGGLVELKEEESESYWVDRSLWGVLADEPTFGPRQVFTCMTRTGVVFLWGCRMPGPDGKTPDWVTIPLKAAKTAETKWTKLYWDQSQKRHRIKVSAAFTEEPKWPDLSLSELLRLAFADRLITEINHPILKKLQGEA